MPLTRLLRWWCLACCLLAGVLLLDAVPILRGDMDIYNWVWPYVPVGIERMAVLAVVLLVYSGTALWAVRRQRTFWTLLLAIVGVIVIQVTVIWLRYPNPLLELFNRTLSPMVTGPHFIAAHVNWQNPSEWHDWTLVMDKHAMTSIHMAISPPGLPMFYGGVNQLLEGSPPLATFLQERLLPNQCYSPFVRDYTPAEWASLWFGILMPLWSALTVLPLYGVARRLMNPQIARWLVLCWAVVPTVAMMSPVWNLLYPLVCLCAFWGLLIGFERRHGAGWFIASGFLVGLTTFANLSVVPFIAFCGMYTLLHYAFNERGQRPFYRPVVVGLWFFVGLSAIWVLYTLTTGTTFLDILQRAFGQHLGLERPFLPWLWYHAWEWALFGTLPLIGLWLWQAFRTRRGGNVLALALLGTLVMMLLSNTARGETGRVWLFFTPLAMLAAGQALSRFTSPPYPLSDFSDFKEGGLAPLELNAHSATSSSALRTQPSLYSLLIARCSLFWHSALRTPYLVLLAHAALAFALACTWDTMFAPDIFPPPPVPAPYEAVFPQDTRFGDVFRLVGWQGSIAENTLTLHLNLQAQRQLMRYYAFSVVAVAPDGSTLPALVWSPHDNRYPQTCWQPDQIIGETVTIPLPPAAPSGDWWLSLGVIPDLARPDERLPVTLPDGTADTQVGLGPVRGE